MSFDSMVREMVREEVRRLITPVMGSLADLQTQQREVVSRLAQVFRASTDGGKRASSRSLKGLFGVSSAGRGPGRPRRSASGSTSGEARICAIEDCGKPARSKGYCAAHYQKYRMLEKTDRLPSDWVADAAPGTVKNVVLPRGRAGAKALAASKKKASS